LFYFLKVSCQFLIWKYYKHWLLHITHTIAMNIHYLIKFTFSLSHEIIIVESNPHTNWLSNLKGKVFIFLSTLGVIFCILLSIFFFEYILKMYYHANISIKHVYTTFWIIAGCLPFFGIWNCWVWTIKRFWHLYIQIRAHNSIIFYFFVNFFCVNCIFRQLETNIYIKIKKRNREF